MVYLLARFEENGMQQGPVNRASYVEMLSALQDEIRNRKPHRRLELEERPRFCR